MIGEIATTNTAVLEDIRFESEWNVYNTLSKGENKVFVGILGIFVESTRPIGCTGNIFAGILGKFVESTRTSVPGTRKGIEHV